MEKDIEQIEYYYNVLCNYNSFQTFDIYADAFFDNILSIASVKVIVDSLIEVHPIDDSVFDEHSKSEAPYILDYFSDNRLAVGCFEALYLLVCKIKLLAKRRLL